jgi:hypothetical protein
VGAERWEVRHRDQTGLRLGKEAQHGDDGNISMIDTGAEPIVAVSIGAIGRALGERSEGPDPEREMRIGITSSRRS